MTNRQTDETGGSRKGYFDTWETPVRSERSEENEGNTVDQVGLVFIWVSYQIYKFDYRCVT